MRFGSLITLIVDDFARDLQTTTVFWTCSGKVCSNFEFSRRGKFAESGSETFLRRGWATTNFLVENLSVATVSCAGWGGRARLVKTPVQLARRGAAPALDVAKNIPTVVGRTRPAFFPRKNASGQGKDGAVAGERRPCERSAGRSPTLTVRPLARWTHRHFTKNVWRTVRSDHHRNKNY